MPPNDAGKHAGRIGIWGTSGSGKTTYLLQRLADRRRVVVMDPTGSIVKHGFKACRTVDAVRAGMVADWTGFRLAYTPVPGHEPRCLNQLCGILATAQQGYLSETHTMQLTLAVDEMADAFPAAGGLKNAPKFAALCSQGRHLGIELFGCSQRIAEVHSRFRGNCSEAVVFQNLEPNDVARSAATLGLAKAAVEALEQFEYLHRVRAKHIERGTVTAGRKKR